MPMFMKKVLVEARQVTEDDITPIAKWCGGTAVCPSSGEKPFPVFVNVPTRDGYKGAQIGDWVVKEENKFRPYTPEAFAREFETLQ